MAKNDLQAWQLDTLKKAFNIAANPKGTSIPDKIQFIKTKETDDGSTVVIGKEDFPPHIMKAFNYYLSMRNSHAQWNQRAHLWDDLDALYNNDPIAAKAMRIVADEIVQADTNMQPIFVEAPRKQKKAILEFFDKINLYSKLTPTAFQLVKYGNAGWILGVERDGITSIILIDIRDFEDRLEFSPAEVVREMNKTQHLKQFVNLERIKQLIDNMQNHDEVTSLFKTYLLGFQITNYLLPPWRFLHFRTEGNISPFKPFGMPPYIHAIGPYKQWDAAMTFQVMARAASFPVEVHKLKISNVVDPVEKFNRARQLINKIDRLGFKSAAKDMKGIGTRIFTIEDAYEYDIKTPEINLGKMGEAEALKDERIDASLLPRFILDSRDSGFGEGGSTLVQKWKPFARFVFTMQNIILEQITQLTKLHLILSGEFEPNEINFILSMPFPESKNDQMATTENQLIDLSKNIMDLLSDRLMNGQPLPVEVVADILQHTNVFDQGTIDSWVDKVQKAREEQGITNDVVNPDNNPDNFNADSETSDNSLTEKHLRNKWKLVEKKLGKESLREQIEEVILSEKQKVFREGLINSSHFYSSKNICQDFDPKFLWEFEQKEMKRLQEEFVREYNGEEVFIESETCSTEEPVMED